MPIAVISLLIVRWADNGSHDRGWLPISVVNVPSLLLVVWAQLDKLTALNRALAPVHIWFVVYPSGSAAKCLASVDRALAWLLMGSESKNDRNRGRLLACRVIRSRLARKCGASWLLWEMLSLLTSPREWADRFSLSSALWVVR